jgi:hypothetical protein
VLVPAGNCTWSSQVSVPNTKGITIQGAGIDVTTITDDFTGDAVLRINIAGGNSLSRVTGFSWDGSDISKSDLGVVRFKGDGLNSFRMDNNKFFNYLPHAFTVNTSTGEATSGLADHNIFNDSGNNVQSYVVIGPMVRSGEETDPDTNFNKPFSRPIGKGTADNVFIEDNTFNYTTQLDHAGTTQGGQRLVFRFNTLNGIDYNNHGADSAATRGAINIEVYGNTGDNTSGGFLRTGILRSGVVTMFNNAYTGNYGNLVVATYRSCVNSNAIWGGQCDGTNSWDQNTGGSEGWRCVDQVGSFLDGGQGANFSTVPAYFWNNTVDGTRKDAVVINAPPFDCARLLLHLIEDRDFYNENPSFDGTSGIGVGPIASRPSTCTPEVGYWATDEGEWNSEQAGADGRLYKCTATDTWTLYYTPYTYPHPLQGAGNGNGASWPWHEAAGGDEI